MSPPKHDNLGGAFGKRISEFGRTPSQVIQASGNRHILPDDHENDLFRMRNLGVTGPDPVRERDETCEGK